MMDDLRMVSEFGKKIAYTGLVIEKVVEMLTNSKRFREGPYQSVENNTRIGIAKVRCLLIVIISEQDVTSCCEK